MTSLEAFNQSLFLALNGSAASPHWGVALARVCAKYLALLVPLLLVGLWLTGRERSRELALRACLVMVLGFVASGLIGMAWPHPRPFMIGLGQLWMPHAPTPSFPSNHGTAFAAVAITLLAGGLRGPGALIAVAGLLVAWARVFVGVHFPLDMLGALGVAYLAYLLVGLFWRGRGRPVTQAMIALYRWLFALPIRAGWLRP